MTKVSRSIIELDEKFHQQVDLLNLANQNFDDGKEFAALNIATTLRVLLHDTNQSTSVLTHIGKKQIDFYETSNQDIHPQSVYLGLIIKGISGVSDGQGGSVLYRPIFTSDFHFINKNWADFSTWWSKIIFRNIDGTSLSRKELVLAIANQEGGAHIDPKVDEKYDKFRHSYSGGMKIIGMNSGIEREFDNIPVLPSVRQVSFEVIESFIKAGLINCPC